MNYTTHWQREKHWPIPMGIKPRSFAFKLTKNKAIVWPSTIDNSMVFNLSIVFNSISICVIRCIKLCALEQFMVQASTFNWKLIVAIMEHAIWNVLCFACFCYIANSKCGLFAILPSLLFFIELSHLFFHFVSWSLHLPLPLALNPFLSLCLSLPLHLS